MFCPRCADELIDGAYGLRCAKGNMELSQDMEHRLNEVFVSKSRPSRQRKFTFKVGGNWFCPADGVKMFEHDGSITCPVCNISLNEFIYELIELHFHKKI
ncbi:MAG TPA: hypothetical protein VGC76_17405 [Pyrinomonadaceae bacterium]|jgi:hypothetical protein